MTTAPPPPQPRRFRSGIIALVVLAAVGTAWWINRPNGAKRPAAEEPPLRLAPRQTVDTSGYTVILPAVPAWEPRASLETVRGHWSGIADRVLEKLRRDLEPIEAGRLDRRLPLELARASCLMYAGKAEETYDLLARVRTEVERHGGRLRDASLASLIYFQGAAALRRGENDNCILCRGESSCIIPIQSAAVHIHPAGSRLGIRHFREYLEHFPDDLGVRWLLNVAHMTLGEHPDQVDPRFLIRLDRLDTPGQAIGRFRDVGHLVGLNRFNQAGGAVMDDFDNDGLLDLAVSCFDAQQRISLYRNRGDGRFDECAADAGLSDQLGGMNLVQGDYNNDGRVDLFIVRGAWLTHAVRPSLLRNEGGMKFTDVTEEAGLLDPQTSIAAQWADYDNDGWLDLFVCNEHGPARLHHNERNGTFKECAASANVVTRTQSCSKGCTWLDFDNDGDPDLFVTFLDGDAQLFENLGNGAFANVSRKLGIDGPFYGFSCWSWDYDNDGWLDIFATCYERTLDDVVRGIVGEPHRQGRNRLFRNLQGRGFQDVTREAGLDLVFAAMGSNFADFDNDGFLDFYLATGEPDLASLVPNRMFRNLDGKRFAEITGSAGVGHLQKGHGVACGDWDRDGDVDLFVETGGVVDGDKYHNILFQNPGQGNSWITVKLVGTRTNRSALGARVKILTAGEPPRALHRHVTSGSSFGGNPHELTIGLGKATKIARLEIHWPASATTQQFHDLEVNQALVIREGADSCETLRRLPIPLPAEIEGTPHGR